MCLSGNPDFRGGSGRRHLRCSGMGYDLYITRAEEWFESESAPISQQEWEAFARGRSELRRSESIRDGDAPAYVWAELPDEETVAFFWSDGRIVLRGVTDESQASTVVILAAALNANLIGDDGENYSP